MKKKSFLISKLCLLAIIIIFASSCIKNDNFIKGDAKIRVFHASSLDTTQNFFENGRPLGSATVTGSNSSYVVVAGDSTYKFTSRNIDGTTDLASLENQRLEIGRNYSVFLTRKTPTAPPSLILTEDQVRIDTTVAKLVFMHLGYTLTSPVIIADEGASFARFTMNYNDIVEKTIKVNSLTKISFALTTPTATNPPPAVTLIDANTVVKGKTYVILIDGTRTGDLQKRMIANN